MGTVFSSNSLLQQYYDQQVKEQIALQNVLFEHKQAMKAAETRRLVGNEFLAAFLTVSLVLLGQKIKQPNLFIIPVFPLVIGLFCNFELQQDMTQDFIKKAADRLFQENRQVFEPVGGPITLAEIDRRIAAVKDHEKHESNKSH
ncbi:unnamed protein product [Thelazia callipaeda]|uniref:PrgI family protein n=1 Tax=Thelazia callipaeda TaxID=103827 RepID=A0A0N5CJZ5_THECL|nr:unnamed protein product [Thelazia callipaeda]